MICTNQTNYFTYIPQEVIYTDIFKDITYAEAQKLKLVNKRFNKLIGKCSFTRIYIDKKKHIETISPRFFDTHNVKKIKRYGDNLSVLTDKGKLHVYQTFIQQGLEYVYINNCKVKLDNVTDIIRLNTNKILAVQTLESGNKLYLIRVFRTDNHKNKILCEQLPYFDNVIKMKSCIDRAIIWTDKGLYLMYSSNILEISVKEKIVNFYLQRYYYLIVTDKNLYLSKSFLNKDLETISYDGNIQKISTDENSFIVQTSTGLYGYGSNTYGQLGLGKDIVNVDVLTYISFFNDHKIIDFRIYVNSTLVLTDKGLYRFGLNTECRSQSIYKPIRYPINPIGFHLSVNRLFIWTKDHLFGIGRVQDGIIDSFTDSNEIKPLKGKKILKIIPCYNYIIYVYQDKIDTL